MRFCVPDIIVSVPFHARCVWHLCDHHLNDILSFIYCGTSIISCLQLGLTGFLRASVQEV